MPSQPDFRIDLAHHWPLDLAITFLNHGSYGACPHTVLEAQRRFRKQLERNPVRFLTREFEPLLDEARRDLAAFLGADAKNLAFIPNTTSGVNAVLRSLRFDPGDELLTTSHAYNACRNALESAAEQTGARLVEAPVPFPIESPDRVIEAILAAKTARTRLALLDHVTKPVRPDLPDRSARARARRVRDRDPCGRRPRARHAFAESRVTGRRILRRQLPQVAVRA